MNAASISWGFSLLPVLIVIVVTAGAVNAFAPQHRPRLRRIVWLGGLYVFAATLCWVAKEADSQPWRVRFVLAADFLSAFIYINAAAMLVFDVILRRLRVELAAITTDLVIGVSYIVSSLAILRSAGLNPAETVATGAVVSAVVALSLQSTLGNILGGIALQLDGSVREGDWLMLENGRQGRVAHIRWRHTTLETRDFDTIVVPNSNLLSSQFTVLGRRGAAAVPHRMWVYFHVDHRYSPEQVIDIVTDALLAAPIERVATDPKPNCLCMDLAHERRQSFALYAVRYYLTDLAVDDPTSSVVRGRIHAALKRAGIPLAMPATAVFVSKDNAKHTERRKAKAHDERAHALGSVELFKPLSSDEVSALADSLRYAPFARGETMTRQGATAHWLYIMTEGTGRVEMKLDSGEMLTIAELKAPACFGEMGLMTGEPRFASVVATSSVECFRLDRAAFARTIKERPEIAKEFSELLAQRRIEMIAARDGIEDSQKALRKTEESERIFKRIQEFFGLE